ncbi:hypothetical protein [Sphingomonas sp.]|uniref:hypothetical protein n=1 Tax=Sphingomonas sp. TaxID=28214 RepID=UPI003D6D481E
MIHRSFMVTTLIDDALRRKEIAMTVQVDLYVDLSRPSCLISAHCFDQVTAMHFVEADIAIDYHPALPIPDFPADGMAMAALVRQCFGLDGPARAGVRS